MTNAAADATWAAASQRLSTRARARSQDEDRGADGQREQHGERSHQADDSADRPDRSGQGAAAADPILECEDQPRRRNGDRDQSAVSGDGHDRGLERVSDDVPRSRGRR